MTTSSSTAPLIPSQSVERDPNCGQGHLSAQTRASMAFARRGRVFSETPYLPDLAFWQVEPCLGSSRYCLALSRPGCTIGSLRSSRRVMDREEFLHRVYRLRGEGESIRSIAKALGVHRSRVERALKALAHGAAKRDVLLGGSSAAGGFVGRHHELGRLNAALEEALAGRGQLVILAGEPGIGKTRTTKEFAACAAGCECSRGDAKRVKGRHPTGRGFRSFGRTLPTHSQTGLSL